MSHATQAAAPTRVVGRRAERGAGYGGNGRIAYLRDVTLHLVGRELSGRYRRSLLGWLRAIVPPLIQLAVFNFVFARVIPLDVRNYAVFLLTGILAWNWFALGLTLATSSLESHRQLVLRPGFATQLLPLVAVLVALVDYVIALPVLLLAVGLTVGLHAAVLLLPALLGIQLVLAVGLGWLLAPLHVFFRDIGHLVGVALLLGFWLTPVFYERSSVPGRFAFIYDVNPMAHLIDAQRLVLLDGAVPAGWPLAAVAVAAVAVFCAGFVAFSAFRQSLPEQL